ncbi:LysM peptidoglycan-binding domain-containing protein [Spirochaeta isovalerica]|uniref:Membrane-bound lytic murein transglycosylase D n=1 Tax=Spirochaeta isovalerica TaxID=150 RepID=A0A841RCA8_9SPIO|nr:LysM peptidoglycan-binding domain-containing protein [Spirochaeta isovalerica]MBB6481625.1 membrane-bound lytic murein transglycosylase D [Spirochaeta isovalerica]
MGWHLLRRYFLILTAAALPLFSHELPHETRQTVSFLALDGENSEEPLPVRRDLRSERIFSYPFDFNETIEKFIEEYSTPERLAYLQRSLDRAAPFRNHIEETIKEKGLPTELVYLPLVESAYRVDAVSRSGATGLWQFMLNSIEPYDITVDQWRDDRRDFWRSTEAALEKLIYNYDKTGNWDLALAAYNCGLNGLRRTMASTGIEDYWELAGKQLLPAETNRYLPKFIAISTICSYGGRYGLDTGWEERLEWEKIELDRSVDLRLLAAETGMDYGTLRLGNAELLYDVTPPADSGYALKIPASHADSLNRVLETSDEAFMEFYRYSIRTGDTLSEISGHYKVPLSLIYRYNRNLSPRFLRAGQTVIIPALADVPPYGSQKGDEVDFTGTYVVREGDSLWSISGRFETTPELLASRNRLPVNGILNIGMKLMVPLTE